MALFAYPPSLIITNLKVWISHINHSLPDTCISVPVRDSFPCVMEGFAERGQTELCYRKPSWYTKCIPRSSSLRSAACDHHSGSADTSVTRD